MANTRQFMAERTAAWAKAGGGTWVNPYSTDGLVAMWDGEWNVAGGVHDSGATVWKDLSGNGWDAYLENAHFSDNAIVYDGNLAAKGLDGQKFPYNDNGYYFEGVFKYEKNGDFSTIFESGLADPYGDYLNNVLVLNGFYGFYSIPYASKPWTRREWSPKIALIGIHHFSLSYSMLKVDQKDATLRDSSDGRYGSSNSNFFTIGSNGSLGRGAGTELYSFRIYQHQPTDQIIAANYAIDKIRFNLT